MDSNSLTLQAAVQLIESFEGIETEAYLDPIGIPTICAGITVYPNGEAVALGDVCDNRICKAHLISLLQKQYVPALEAIPGWARLGPRRQAVLLSFAWNLGARFYGAEGFETITRVLKEGAARPEVYAEMPQALSLYVNAGGQRLPGLIERRRREGEIWMKEDNGVTTFTAKQATVLKKAPIDSSLLSEAGKQAIDKGETVQVVQVGEIAADSHAWFTLEGSGEKWAAYLPHWQAETAAPLEPDQVGGTRQGIDWNDFGCPVGKYITVGEVLQYDLRRKPIIGSQEENALIELCKEFDAIREAWDGPIGVTSGYRPEPINSQVGGVPNSYHTKGMALDIYPIDASMQKFYNWLIQRWTGGFGDGRNRGFIHIDTRNGGKFSRTPDVKPAVVWLY